MSLSPLHARLALMSFLAVGTVTATNILFFQDQALVSSVARSKAERMKVRAEADRTRRLALDPKEETPPVKSVTVAKASLVTVNAKELFSEPSPRPEARAPATSPASPPAAMAERAGRFAPTAGQLDRAASAAPAPAASSEPEMRMPEVVKEIQNVLNQKGYQPGTPDGVVGLVTRAAIMAYEHDHGLPLTGEPSESLLRHMQGGPSAHVSAGSRQRQSRSPNAEHVIRSVQQSLSQLGYFSAKIDGRSGDDTVRAIKEYEMDAGLVPSGRVSAPLLLKLARSTSTPKAR